jgi:hypothetical protein
MAERDYEQEAREQGWKPQGEFTGPDDKWTDAQTFVEKGERIAGIMKSRLDRQDAEIAKLREDNKAFGEYKNEQLEKQKQRNSTLLAELEAQRTTAINDGDGQAFTKLDREIQQVREDIAAPQQQSQELDPLAQAWLMNNDWYRTNSKLQIFADGLAEQLVRGGYSGPAYYEELTRRVKEGFPEEFKVRAQAGPDPVEKGGELQTQVSEAHDYDHLPPESKAACDRFVASGLTTKEDYIANYDWD